MVASRAIVSTAPPASTTPAAGGNVEANTYQFIAGWIFLIVILVMANKTRLGHVIIYYVLLLLILLIIVTEYRQFTPLLNSIQTIGQFDQSQGQGASGNF